jgi:glycosyltransferase involved in cell wall biosynthesis
MTPRVSIIVPAYNAAAYLPYAIDSVLAQTYQDWEIVIVDDGSTDNTRAVVDAYRSRLRDRLQYIFQPNRGVSAARNHGIRAARGEFIALLDADDVWLPQRLELGVNALDADPAVGLVHSRVARIDTKGSVTGAPDLHLGHFSQELPGRSRLVRRDDADDRGPRSLVPHRIALPSRVHQ